MNKEHQQNICQAKKRLQELKARETDTISKIIWIDHQPTLVTTTGAEFRIQGENLSTGFPADHTQARVPSAWEAKRDLRDRKAFSLSSTDTMTFKGSKPLPLSFFADEEQTEAYVQSLKKQK